MDLNEVKFSDDGAHLPQYKSHKTVRAAKIRRIEPGSLTTRLYFGAEGEGSVGLDAPKNAPASMEVNNATVFKHQPCPGWYLVIYEDGYQSFSPADAFEAGYLPMSESEATPIKGYRQLSAGEVGNINEVKELGEQLEKMVQKLRNNPAVDQRAVSIAATELQTGLMWLTRSIAKPTHF